VLIALLATALMLFLPASQPEARVRDADGDGLSNRFERKRSHTNPHRADTDRDRLRDRFELKRSHTNPRRADTDRDGLKDGFEWRRSKTNPRRLDSDGDGYSDGVEVLQGSNPAEAASVPPAPAPAQPSAPPWTCNRTADPSTLTAQWNAAQPGETICLAAGSYGTFRAGSKPGVVAVRPQAGAMPSMSLNFASAANVLVEGVTITGGTVSGTSRNVTVANSTFTGLFLVRASQMTNANIVFDGNTHSNIDTCTTCFQGRLHVDGGTNSGIVIRNSLFSGGTSDGVRLDGDDVHVIGNRFLAFRNQDPFHTDPIQMYGGDRAVIRGNYFDNSGGDISAYIMMADGGSGHVLENNVFAPGGHIFSLTWYSDDSSIIRHNTFVDGPCFANVRCGTLNLGAKPADDLGRGTVIRDNVVTAISADGNGEGGGVSQFSSDHNLFVRQNPIGPGDIRGTPVYTGGGGFGGFRLAAGSPGKGAASDGTDIGIP
jgi:Right handed beta helix region/Bacterial TSP3 repeat